MTNNIRSKIWNLIRGGSFHGYLRTASGYPLTLTGCMAEYPVSLSVSGKTVQDGKPSPDSPVEIQGVGDRTSNEPYGYKVPLVMSSSDGEKQTFPIYMDTPLYGNGNISDTVELDISNKTATLTRKYGMAQFDGSEGWSLQTGIGNNVYTIKLDNAAYSNYSENNSVANLLPISDRYSVEAGTRGYHINTVNILSIYTDNSSLSDFKAWLAAQAATGTPFTIIYRLKSQSSVTTDISDIQGWDSIPKLWRGTVIITADTTVQPSSITAKYYADKPDEEVN